MSNFGGLTDHFTLASASLILIDAKKTLIPQNRVDAQDDRGGIAASAYHGNTAGSLYEASCTYNLKSSTLDLSTLDCGELASGTIVESIEVSTGNAEWPTITVSGKIGTEAVTAPSGYLNTFPLPAFTITGLKQAQTLGFTVTQGRLTGSSLSASIDLAELQDGVGEPAAHGLGGGTGEVKADFVRFDATAPAWGSLDSSLTETMAPGVEEPQAGFHTASASAAFTLSRDTTP